MIDSPSFVRQTLEKKLDFNENFQKKRLMGRICYVSLPIYAYINTMYRRWMQEFSLSLLVGGRRSLSAFIYDVVCENSKLQQQHLSSSSFCFYYSV